MGLGVRLPPPKPAAAAGQFSGGSAALEPRGGCFPAGAPHRVRAEGPVLPRAAVHLLAVPVGLHLSQAQQPTWAGGGPARGAGPLGTKAAAALAVLWR